MLLQCGVSSVRVGHRREITHHVERTVEVKEEKNRRR